jgi:hypothetical protein
MKNNLLAISILMAILCVFLLSNTQLHKDRIERPVQYTFLFKNKEKITLKTANGSLSQSVNDDILNGRKEVIEAELTFKTGEKLYFKRNGAKWTDIFIVYDKDTVKVPLKTLIKIPDIHFKTVALLWGDSDKKALESGYFYLRFEIGRIFYFNRFDELHLGFSDKKLNHPKVTKQIDSNSRQDSDF